MEEIKKRKGLCSDHKTFSGFQLGDTVLPHSEIFTFVFLSNPKLQLSQRHIDRRLTVVLTKLMMTGISTAYRLNKVLFSLEHIFLSEKQLT